MRGYVDLVNSRRVGVKIRMGPGKNETKMVKRHRSKQGYESLIYNPQVGINFQLYNPDMTATMLTFNITMAPHLAHRIAEVYEAVATNAGKIYVKDELGKFTVDRERAITECGRKITAFTSYLEIYPGLDYDDPEGDNRCVIFQVNEIAAPMPMHKVKILVNVLEGMDVATYSLLCALGEQISDIDDTTRRIESKVDMLIGNKRPTESRHILNKPLNSDDVKVDWNPIDDFEFGSF